MSHNKPPPPTRILVDGKFSGIVSGWGETRVLALDYQSAKDVKVAADSNGPIETSKKNENKQWKRGAPKGLNTLLALSIAGCDIMSSTLYTSSNCAKKGGKVSCFFFSKIYFHVFLFVFVFPYIVGSSGSDSSDYHAFLFSEGLPRSSYCYSSKWRHLQYSLEHCFQENRQFRGSDVLPRLCGDGDRLCLRCGDLSLGDLALSQYSAHDSGRSLVLRNDHCLRSERLVFHHLHDVRDPHDCSDHPHPLGSVIRDLSRSVWIVREESPHSRAHDSLRPRSGRRSQESGGGDTFRLCFRTVGNHWL
jgi:hypothetical protein